MGLVKEKGQDAGYGGLQCAEPNPVVNAGLDKTLGEVVYSLAYDQQGRYYKAACGRCKKLLAKYDIKDLWVE